MAAATERVISVPVQGTPWRWRREAFEAIRVNLGSKLATTAFQHHQIAGQTIADSVVAPGAETFTCSLWKICARGRGIDMIVVSNAVIHS